MKKVHSESTRRPHVVAILSSALAISSLFASVQLSAADAGSISQGEDLGSIIGGSFSALGPVESVDSLRKVVVVLGQSFKISAQTTIAFEGGAVLATKGIKLLKVGDYVVIRGYAGANGTVADVVASLGVPYVTGASPTFVRGAITSVDQSTGALTIGSLRVDVTSLLVSQIDSAVLAVGTVVDLLGTQPASRGVMLAGGVAVVDSIIGGSAQSIIGGSTQSIIGGSTQSIIGGSIQSIIGGSAQSIIGGSIQSIIGGSAQSIIGGSTQSIIGGSTQSIIGGSTQSIIGGSTQSIIGGSTQSIIGGSTQSIIGGSTQSIIGGSTQSIIGGSAE